jgi:hypothetical protein
MAEFRQRKNAPKLEQSANLRGFVEAYHEAGPETLSIFNEAMHLLEAYGFDPEGFDRRDVLLLREALFSIIIRYRGEFHPLHTMADEFDKYFNKLEFFLDTEWQNADEDPDDEGPERA